MVTDSKLEAKIAEIKAAHEANANREINFYKLSFEVEGASKELAAKHKAEDKELLSLQNKQTKDLLKEQAIDNAGFELKYGIALSFPKFKKESVSTNFKCNYISTLKDKNGELKFKYVDGKIVGAKGEPIKSTIIYKDANGIKQSLSVAALINHLS